jgi:hypothetical protein
MLTPIQRPHAGLLAVLLLAPTIASAQIRAREGTAIVRDPSTSPTLQTTPPPPPGPPPQGIRFQPDSTYGIFAKIAWNAAPNARSYVVTRGKSDDPACCNATSGELPASTTSWVDMGLFRKGSYTYTLTVNYADGSVGKGGMTLGVLHNAAPTQLAVNFRSPGMIRITWDAGSVPGTCCIKIAGPGLGPTGEKMVLGGGPLDLPFLPQGAYTWKVVGAYDVKNLPAQPSTNYGSESSTATVYGTTTQVTDNYVVLAPPSEWAELSTTVAVRSGRYRIALEGFKAINVTAEDPFRSDGRGDEVFITTQVSEYGPAGQMVSSRMVRTPTFGDKQNFPARVQAGSASATGGIMPGDRYPAEAKLISELQPLTTNNLPFLLWEGELSEVKGLVMLSPAVWESDEGGDQLFPPFAAFHSAAASNVPYRNQFQSFVPWTPTPAKAPALWNPQKSCPVPLGNGAPTLFVPQIGGWRDEPIDMNPDHSYCPTFVAINWSIADTWTRVNPASVLEIPFKNAQTNWEYILYVRIEKVQEPTATVAPVRMIRREGQ